MSRSATNSNPECWRKFKVDSQSVSQKGSQLFQPNCEATKSGSHHDTSASAVISADCHRHPEAAASLEIYLLSMSCKVKNIPVNYAILFSGPVSTVTARRVRHGVGADLSANPALRQVIKAYSSPAAFLITLSLPLSLLFTFLQPPGVAPQAASSSTYSLWPPLPTEPIRRGL